MPRVKLSSLTKFSFLPSIFTVFSLLVGFLAMIQFFKGNFVDGVYLIFISVILDGFDGTIARLTKTESHFGMYLDSLVDAITFGVVTAVLIYLWAFNPAYPQIGKVVSFIFLSAGIIRLARFNVLKEVGAYSSNIFVGLPIPIAAISVASLVLIVRSFPQGKLNNILFSIFVVAISFLMISNIKYRGLKKLSTKYNLFVLFAMTILIAFFILYPDFTIPLIAFSYILSPALFFIIDRVKKRRTVHATREVSEE